MKKIIAVVLCLSMLFCLASCKVNPTAEDETETVHFESTDDAYEAMTDAVLDGDYSDAIKYYNSGAADANDLDVVNWYFYSMAMNEYEENGCIGYPLNLLQYNVSEDFQPAKTAIGNLQSVVRDLNGVYENTGMYLYFADGKIAISVGTQLTGMVFCNSEIVYKDEVYYFAERGQDGSHKLLYTITKTDSGVRLDPTEENTDDVYSGQYVATSAEFPELIY